MLVLKSQKRAAGKIFRLFIEKWKTHCIQFFSDNVNSLFFAELLVFRVVAEPRNSGKSAKFTKTRKIPRNAVEILSNTCPYSNFETCLSYWGYLLAVNSQIYVKTSSLKRANNVPKLPGVDYVAKNWALAMMLKALPLVHFWSVLLLKEQMMTSVRKTLKTLV